LQYYENEGKKYYESGDYNSAKLNFEKVKNYYLTYSPVPHYYLSKIYSDDEEKRLERIKCELCVLQYPYMAEYNFKFLKRFKVLYDFKLSDTEIVKSEPFNNPYKVLFEYHRSTEKICNKENIPFCFIALNGDEFIERDTDHPNEKGHKKISEIIYRNLKRYF